MKFSLMTLNYLPNKGGLVSYVQNISKEIIRLGHEVEIYTTDGKDVSLSENEYIDNIRVNRQRVLKMNSVTKLFTPITASFKLYRKLIKQVDKENYVIVRHLYFAAALSLFKERERIIYIIPLVAPRLQKMNIKQVGKFKKIYYYFLIPQLYIVEKFTLNRLSYIGTLSNTKKEEITTYYNIPADKVTVIPPGVDLKRFKPLIDENEKNEILKTEELSCLKEFKILLTVCRLSNEKNVIYAIDVIKNLNDEYKLVIVGDGEEFSTLKRYVMECGLEKQVIFTGFKTNIEDYYKVSDIFILPSRYEGFGHVYLEAMASGVPCIGLEHNPPKIITATHEIIKNGLNGYIDTGENPKTLADRIKVWFETPDLVSELKVNSRKYVEKNHSWKAHIDSIVSVLEKK